MTVSGEAAFKVLNEGFAWAKRPMMDRIGDVERSISMTFVHGSDSWIDNRIGYEVKYIRDGSFVDVLVCTVCLCAADLLLTLHTQSVGSFL